MTRYPLLPLVASCCDGTAALIRGRHSNGSAKVQRYVPRARVVQVLLHSRAGVALVRFQRMSLPAECMLGTRSLQAKARRS